MFISSIYRRWLILRWPGISGDSKLFILHCADDQVIFAENEDVIYYIVEQLNDARHDWGLIINIEKTKYLVLGANDRGKAITKQLNAALWSGN